MSSVIFVYALDGGLFNALAHSTHKLVSPETYPCKLCSLTNDVLGAKREWAQFIGGIGVTTEFLHHNEFAERHPDPAARHGLPAVFLSTGNGPPEVLITDAELVPCRDLGALIALVRERVKQTRVQAVASACDRVGDPAESPLEFERTCESSPPPRDGAASSVPDGPVAGKRRTSRSLLCSLAGLWQGAKRTLAGRTATPDVDAPRLRSEVRKLYARVATDPGGAFHFHRGAEYAVITLGYDRAELDALPQASTESFAGVANPHLVDPLRLGEVVLDIGSGSGTDLLLAARRVGPSGRAIGVDMTDEMIRRCHAAIAESGLQNVEVRRGDAENLPVDDATVDAVTSNGVLNLVPGKERAFREIYRVLRPGGRLLLGDIVVSAPLAPQMVRNIDLWTG